MPRKPLAFSKLLHVMSPLLTSDCWAHALRLRGGMHWMLKSGCLRCCGLDRRLHRWWRWWRRWLHWGLRVWRRRRSGTFKFVGAVTSSWWRPCNTMGWSHVLHMKAWGIVVRHSSSSQWSWWCETNCVTCIWQTRWYRSARTWWGCIRDRTGHSARS